MDSHLSYRAFSRQRFRLEGIEDAGRTVGNGAYATVREYEFRGLTCVGKKMHGLLYEHASPDQRADMLQRFEEECELLSRLHHPSIVQFLGVHVEPDSLLPVLVMEYLPTGNLSGYLDRHGTLPDDISYGILRDVALGLRYLHEHTPPIIHRDLSANNVLLTTSLSAKISDLGVAKILNLSPSQMTQHMSTKAPGTPCYMPPEALIARPSYTIKIDSYSFGVMILHVLCGQWPLPTDLFQHDSENPSNLVPVTEVERRTEFLQQIGTDHPLTDLVQQCLSNAPSLRPEARVMLHKINAAACQAISDPPPTKLELMRRLEQEAAERKKLEGELLLVSLEKEFLGAEIEALREATRMQLESDQSARGPSTAAQLPASAVNNQHFGAEAGRSLEPRLPSDPRLQWSRCTDAPVKTNHAHIVVIGDKLYMGGGTTPDRTDGDRLLFEYDRQSDAWSTLPRCPVRGAAVAQFGGQLVMVGGFYAGIHSFTGRVHRFKSGDQRWEVFLPPMPTARAWLSVVTTATAIVAAGGDTIIGGKPRVCAAVEVYSSETSQWHRADSLPAPVYAAASTMIGETFFLLGGTSKLNTDSKECFQAALPLLIKKAIASTPPSSSSSSPSPSSSSSSSSSVWSRLAPTPLSRSTAASLAGSLLAVGGWDGLTASPSVHVLRGGKWERLADGDLPVARMLCAARLISADEVIVVGGVDEALMRSNAVFVGAVSGQAVV